MTNPKEVETVKEEYQDPFESDAPASTTTVKEIGETCTACEG